MSYFPTLTERNEDKPAKCGGFKNRRVQKLVTTHQAKGGQGRGESERPLWKTHCESHRCPVPSDGLQTPAELLAGPDVWSSSPGRQHHQMDRQPYPVQLRPLQCTQRALLWPDCDLEATCHCLLYVYRHVSQLLHFTLCKNRHG